MWNKFKRMLSGIRFRMLIGMLATFAVGCIVLQWMVTDRLQSNYEKQMESDLQELRSNSEVYVRQLLMLKKENNDSDGFKEIAADALNELYASGNNPVAAYTTEGRFLKAVEPSYFGGERREDFQNAMKGKASYTLEYQDGDKLNLYFSTPVTIEGKTVGILCYYLDQSEYLKQETRTSYVVLRGAILVFIFIFIVVFIMFNNFLKPVRQLSLFSNDISRQVETDSLEENVFDRLPGAGRRDEVGELAGNYGRMLKKIMEQLEKIGSDKDRILQLMDDKQEFYNNVTHELKTPLTTISGYAQLIQDNKEDETLFEKGIEHILKESGRLHQMVVQLLEMSEGREDMEMEPVELCRLLEQICDSMEIKAKRYGAHIRKQLNGPMLMDGQEGRLREVFINLLDNAIKYGEVGREIITEAFEKEGMLIIRVWNYGEPLDENELSRIFNPFYRVDKELSREQGSAGLGLAICRQIVEKHGGSIKAECTEDGRICFTVIFAGSSKRKGAGEYNEEQLV